MLKKMMLVLGLMLLPGAAMAQQHAHGEHKAEARPAMDHREMAKKHEAVIAQILSNRAELKLTDEQFAKLQKFQAKVQEHHRAEAAQSAHQHSGGEHAQHAEHDAEASMHTNMHNEFMSIFTDSQKVKVQEMMKKAEKCDTAGEKVCKI